MADKLNEKINGLFNDVVKTVRETGDKAATLFGMEKQKAELRSEIGHNSRDLTKAYEKLGREYYAAKTEGRELTKSDTFELITSKEKIIELLNEKLDALEK